MIQFNKFIINGVFMAIKLEEYAKNKVRSEMKVRGITTETMCKLLNEKLGISLKEQSFNNKLHRSNFNTTFFFQCMYAIGAKYIHFEIEDIKP